MKYLGFWVTQNGILPINNKIESIVHIMPPKPQKQVRVFIGLTDYYRYMCVNQSHLLNPLTTLMSNKVNFKWIDVEKKTFEEIRRSVARNKLFYILISMNALKSVSLLAINS